jgi:hypothetical protein
MGKIQRKRLTAKRNLSLIPLLALKSDDAHTQPSRLRDAGKELPVDIRPDPRHTTCLPWSLTTFVNGSPSSRAAIAPSA